MSKTPQQEKIEKCFNLLVEEFIKDPAHKEINIVFKDSLGKAAKVTKTMGYTLQNKQSRASWKEYPRGQEISGSEKTPHTYQNTYTYQYTISFLTSYENDDSWRGTACHEFTHLYLFSTIGEHTHDDNFYSWMEKFEDWLDKNQGWEPRKDKSGDRFQYQDWERKYKPKWEEGNPNNQNQDQENFKLAGLIQLKDKLLNLNPLYNRKIRFYISERLAWDLTELLNKNEPKLVSSFSSSVLNLISNSLETKKELSFNLEPFFWPHSPETIAQFQKKIIHLRKKSLAISQEKGYNSLFLGAVFVRGYFYNSSEILRLVNAPLFFLPCDLEKTKYLSLVFRSESRINSNLLYYLQKELGLSKEKLTDFVSKLKNDQGIAKWEDYLCLVVQEFRNLLVNSSLQVKLSPLVSSFLNLENKEVSREVKISPFSEPEGGEVENNNTSNFEKFFKVGEKNPPVKFTGKIIKIENRKVEKGEYIGNNYYLLLAEHNDNRYINPKKIFVFEDLLRDKSIWQLLTNQEEYYLGKFYTFYCWSDSPMGFKLSFWEKNKNDLNGQMAGKGSKGFNLRPEPFVKLVLSKKPKNAPLNQLEIALNFCLTIDSEPNLSLFHDFEKIIEEYSQGKTINWSNSALNLLRGEVESVLSYSEPPEEKNQPLKPLQLPFSSDPSQTRILKIVFQHFSENTLCIDGPPGTGKSQLICNLLANALVEQKKVLVICEKEVALKVIADKLASIGLSRSVVKINDLAQTSQIYRDMLNYLEKNQTEEIKPDDYQENYQRIANLEERQAANLKKIVDYCRIENEFRIKHQIPLSEVYLKFESKYRLSSALIQLNKEVRNKEQLEKLKLDLKNYVGKFSQIFVRWKLICLSLPRMFLEPSSRSFEFDWENQKDFQEIISDLLKELKGEPTQTNLLSRIWRIKLFSEYSQVHQSTSRLEEKLKDLETLVNEPNYQKFYTFLQVENFNQFWQKCGDREFLITLQQFISEEFLAVGELCFFFTDCREDTRKNIDYFLRQILINREFNYFNYYEKDSEQAVYFNWLKEVEAENREVLANWNQGELVRIQQEQKEINQKKRELVKIILKNKQAQNLNQLFLNQTLKRELSKKRKIAALKKLFPELVNYFPLWLTTPEVIASITNLQTVPFDFIVFDEASQMPLEKSIPLWARAKKCLVIGDEQQLPPTDFFRSHLEVEEEDWKQEAEAEKLLSGSAEKVNLEAEDLEKNSNLLTYAKKYAPNREKLTLLYHYRSKYPELIEFSNQAFYNGILQIVAAGELSKKGYFPIEYHYQTKGRWINAENQVEARYIIELLKELPSDKEIGIITFNVKQRDLLVDSIEEGNHYKNLFIKNLEEVQGDERDIIIFSVGFAPNQEGKIRLNFGPLSKEGGEKRLNVAISRAREKMIVVTSLLPKDLSRIIEEDENRKLGPKLFKKYLEYAYSCSKEQIEKTQEILKTLPKIVNTFSSGEETERREEFGSLFEEQIYNELIKQNYGYEVHRQVKSIGYQIDLALWDSQIQQYILGIECDGEYWHGKLENIERDIYRQQLLENKGWRILCILSRDWCRNQERELERIRKEIEVLRTNFA
ncbi:MAG: DUF4011 domain-containing protein [Candidatus Moeniiplasma glomeromycotorum]|nr:DUF4011 domain-containing protein [Candidatus Moeniiplasma glomeromycotorum]MCE8167366.1 DUF4011 domain-containing protein [Candidatus Moeniiplasma glomeromycotorum]MCE8168621.1 DUF4011 domain-containing protein [Candidatus Moeniiplasma glomeromycotorum]